MSVEPLTKQYILFVDYGLSGWEPQAQSNDPQELVRFAQERPELLAGGWLIVKRLDIVAVEEADK